MVCNHLHIIGRKDILSTGFSRKSAAMMILGSSILAMGMCNIHAHSGVTEGGVLGLTLLLEHLFAISPALSALILNVLCYALGWRTLGRGFLLNSAVACLCYSAVYALLEPFAPMFPLLISSQLVASLVGSLFVGFGAGICVRYGGAPGGDDALSMSLSRITRLPIQWVYLLSDLIVLSLSLCYIPLGKIAYSLLTVILSGQLIGIVERFDVRLMKREGLRPALVNAAKGK